MQKTNVKGKPTSKKDSYKVKGTMIKGSKKTAVAGDSEGEKSIQLIRGGERAKFGTHKEKESL